MFALAWLNIRSACLHRKHVFFIFFFTVCWPHWSQVGVSYMLKWAWWISETRDNRKHKLVGLDKSWNKTASSLMAQKWHWTMCPGRQEMNRNMDKGTSKTQLQQCQEFWLPSSQIFLQAQSPTAWHLQCETSWHGPETQPRQTPSYTKPRWQWRDQ